MKAIERVLDIPANPSVVWQVLCATHEYGEWNPFITQLDGDLRVGARLRVQIALAGRGMTFKPVVTTVDDERRLQWRGRLGVPGIFDGVHEFRLEPLPAGGTRFVQSETFTGLLVPLLGRTLGDTAARFEAMNDALRTRAVAAAAKR